MKPTTAPSFRIDNSLLWQGTALVLAMAVIALPLLWLDGRLLDGALLWPKPIKFGLSLAIHLVTLSVLATLLPAVQREGRAWSRIVYLTVAAAIFEMFYITLQAARGRASHFNFETPTEASLYSLMGLGAFMLVFASFYLGRKLYAQARAQGNSLLILGAAHGLAYGSVLTLLMAGYMSAGTSHFSGSLTPEAVMIPLFGWSIGPGDMRIPHFFATHMMQIFPVIGFCLDRQGIEYNSGRKHLLWLTLLFSLALLSLFAVIAF